MSFYVHSTHLHRSIQPFTYLPQLWPILLPCLSSQRFLCHIHQLHNRNELDNHFLHNQSFSSAWFHWEILANSSQSIRVTSIPTTFLISIFFTVSTVSDVDSEPLLVIEFGSYSMNVGIDISSNSNVFHSFPIVFSEWLW